MSETFKKISGHGAIPLVIGFFLAATGPSAMKYRFLGLLICALWFSLDVGIWIAKANRTTFWKHWLFCATTYLSFLFAMLAMKGILVTSLADDEAEAFDGLHAKIELPSSRINSESTYTVTNDGHSEIGTHALFCQIVAGETPSDSYFENVSAVWGSPSDHHIEPGGDAESQGCVKNIYGSGGLYSFGEGNRQFSCMDVIVGIQYVLTSQPATVMKKAFRFLSRATDGYDWRQISLTTTMSPCKSNRQAAF